MKQAIIAAIIMMASSAHACSDSMRFTQDKQKHFAVSAALGVVARSVTDNKASAFGLALIPGIAKEAYDTTGKGCTSINDMAWNAIGAAVGVYSTNWIIGPKRVVYRMEF